MIDWTSCYHGVKIEASPESIDLFGMQRLLPGVGEGSSTGLPKLPGALGRIHFSIAGGVELAHPASQSVLKHTGRMARPAI